MRLRVARQEDEVALAALLGASYAQLLAPDYDAKILARALPAMSSVQPLLLASGSYYVAEHDGAIAACGGWTREAPRTGEISDGVGHVRHFATHPCFTRRGAASLLLEHCIDEAARAGVNRLYAMSTRTAVKFYAAHGFVPIGAKSARFPGGIKFPGVEMRLDL